MKLADHIFCKEEKQTKIEIMIKSSNLDESFSKD